MRSPTTAARAIIMLACLILIPLVALFGSSLPELMTTLLEGRCGPATVSSAEGLSEAPVFRPEETPPLLADHPAHAAGTGVVPAHVGTTAGAEVPVGYNLPAVSANPGASPPGAPPSPSANPPLSEVGLDRMQPADEPPSKTGLSLGIRSKAIGPRAVDPQPAPSGAGRPQPTGSQTAVVSPPSPSEGGTFVLIQERLRDLGAVYYRLESWGSQQQLFRFQCEMAVDGSPGLTRHFEAVDNHPLLAMHKVLVEAEAWHASR